ncbi:restriction endonuclease subunit S [Aliarcobacter butzleri]|uniref:restriction endonuclease subunit S n=1 Tax=Aliarcobacter butzleri TaxID=28197 RepID=UPI00125F5840|nr:restriction endonuclease subunit S [Aliarcobacter butzleri]MCT7644112.1 restriction endonuclease subunit S [Aliarcobacter butzleri]
MKYKKYPSYKHSGVEWFGEIPSEWGIKKLKYISSIQTGSTPLTSNDSYFSDEIGIPWIKPDELNNLVPIKTSKKFLTEKGKNISRIIKKDSVLVCGIGTIGKFGIAGVALTTNQQINSVTFNNKLNFNYGKFLIASSQQEMDKFSNGNVVKILNTESQKNIDYPFPSFEEQQQIANFLDKATAKIDILIEKQTKLIEILKEKRQAVISHAVTKGINPNVPMKDSGVEWLGEIPEHWELSKLRFLFSFSTGLNITKANLIDDGMPCVSYGEIHSKYGFEVNADINDLKYVDYEYLITSKSSLLSKGDFIFADTSEDVKGAGNFTHIVGDTKVFAGYHTVIARLKDNYNSRFFAYVFDSNVFRTQIQLAIKGVKVFSITQAILKNCSIWFPFIEEQQQIANYLDDKTSKIDTLIEKSNKSIELLREKRTALISAAVTGKIDVREEV